MARLGAGFKVDSGMLSALDDTDIGDAGSTSILFEAAVEGLISWAGEGLRLMEADCIAEAISMAGFDMLEMDVEVAIVASFKFCSMSLSKLSCLRVHPRALIRELPSAAGGCPGLAI